MIAVEEIKICGLTLQGVTRGGIETCLHVPELGVMFDVGLCPWGASDNSNVVFISHGHADHAAGLPYLISQRHLRRLPPPQVHLPIEIGPPMIRVLEAWSEIEGYPLVWNIQGHAPGAVVALEGDLRARALRTIHRIPSLGWLVERTSQRLKPEFQGLPGKELAALRKSGTTLTQEHIKPILCVTGDTQIEFFDAHEEVRRSQVLIHEVTGWDDRMDVANTRKWGHTHIEEILERADMFQGEMLVLVHRSQRWTREEAEGILQRRCPAVLRGRVMIFG